MDRKGKVPSWPREPVLQGRCSRQSCLPQRLGPGTPSLGKERAAGIEKGESVRLGRQGGPRRGEDLSHRSAKGAGWRPPASLNLCCGGEAGAESAWERGSGDRTGEPESRGTPSPFSGLPAPQPAPCSCLMLTSFATRKVCLEARTRGKGQGKSERCWGRGCILINNKI